MEGLNENCTMISNGIIHLLQSYIVTYKRNLRKYFLLRMSYCIMKISNKDLFVGYAAIANIAEDALKEYGDLALLK